MRGAQQHLHQVRALSPGDCWCRLQPKACPCGAEPRGVLQNRGQKADKGRNTRSCTACALRHTQSITGKTPILLCPKAGSKPQSRTQLSVQVHLKDMDTIVPCTHQPISSLRWVDGSSGACLCSLPCSREYHFFSSAQSKGTLPQPPALLSRQGTSGTSAKKTAK